MTKQQLIQIAKVGFPERVKQFINFEDAEMHLIHGVYRLYDKYKPFFVNIPKEYYLSIFIGDDNFIQIEAGNTAFNHYAAIKEMENLKLI